MPLHKDTGQREHESYCSYCFKQGELCYKGNDLKEFQNICYKSMREHGVNLILAKIFTFMIRFAPRWKKTN
jgi:hypothetical protein